VVDGGSRKEPNGDGSYLNFQMVGKDSGLEEVSGEGARWRGFPARVCLEGGQFQPLYAAVLGCKRLLIL